MNFCVITREASQDLDAISDYFLSRNIEAGERFLQEFNQKCSNLLTFPKMGKSYAVIRPWLRGIPIDGYIIFYEITESEIIILRVVNGRQNLEDLFAEASDD